VKNTENIDEIKKKFLVESYDGKTPKTLQNKMNERHRDGYCPIAIEINHYQGEVEGFIVYELQEESK